MTRGLMMMNMMTWLLAASSRAGITKPRGAPRFMVGVVMVCALAACDFTVTNPGPVSDDALGGETSQAAVVTGAVRQLVAAHNLITVYGSYFAREGRNSGGSTEGNPYGATALRNVGRMDPVFANGAWALAHTARFLAEEGIRRMDGTLGAAAAQSEPYMMAHLWAGFANRLLGENMCFSVIDGGPARDSDVHFARADSQFTRAMDLAVTQGKTNVQSAARAGRASVRASLGQWPQAMADAAGVPASFVWFFPTSAEAVEIHNSFARANNPYRRWSVDGTWVKDYFTATADPRTPWGTDTRKAEDANIVFLPEKKYGPGNFAVPHRLSQGAEMRLIIAEGLLRSGSWPAARDTVNAIRAGVKVPLRTATSPAEAWTALKLERLIVLWLEGRAMPDHRRYREEGTPGPLPALLDVTGRDLCYPISQIELDTNPNIP